MGKPREKHCVFCIDFLEITYEATKEIKEYISELEEDKLYYFKDDHSFWLQRTQSRNYHDEFVIWYEHVNEWGDCIPVVVGYLRSNSPNPKRKDVYLTFENASLYSNLLGKRFHIAESLRLKFKRISKIDIAADFDFNFQKRLLQTLKDSSYDIILNRKLADRKNVKGLDAHTYDVNVDRLFEHPQVTFHNDDRVLSAKVYNKRKEIMETSKKHYISQYVGFGNTHYRFEVSVRGVKRLTPCFRELGIDNEKLYQNLEDEDLLHIMYINLMNRLIHLRKKRKKINIIDAVLNTCKSNLSIIKRCHLRPLVNSLELQKQNRDSVLESCGKRYFDPLAYMETKKSFLMQFSLNYHVAPNILENQLKIFSMDYPHPTPFVGLLGATPTKGRIPETQWREEGYKLKSF